MVQGTPPVLKPPAAGFTDWAAEGEAVAAGCSLANGVADGLAGGGLPVDSEGVAPGPAAGR